MAVTYATVSSAGSGPGPRLKYEFYPETTNNTVTIAAEGYTHVGPFEATTDANGGFEVDIPLDTDQGGDSLVWRVVETPVTRIEGRGVGSKAARTIGSFEITEDIDYDNLVAAAIEPLAVTPTVYDNVGALVEQAEDAAAAAAAVGATTDAQIAGRLADTSSLTVAALAEASIPGLPAINDGTGRQAADKVTIDPSQGSGDDTRAVWQIAMSGKGRLMHLVHGSGLAASGVRDLIAMGVDGYGGNGLLVSVKGVGGLASKGINAALQSDAVAGSYALYVTQANANSPAVSMQTSVATHAPVLELVANDAGAGQRLFRVQTATAGVYVTTAYIDSQTGAFVFQNVEPIFASGMQVKNTIDFGTQTVDEARITAKATSGQTANFFEAQTEDGSAYLWRVTSAGRTFTSRVVVNGTSSGVAGLFVGGEGSSLANVVVRAHATTPGSLVEWQNSDGTVVYTKVDKAGFLMTRKTAAPADADLATSEVAWWFDNTAGLPRVGFKGKDSAGTVAAVGVNNAWQTLFQGKHRLDAVTAQTTALHETQTNALAGSGGYASVFHIDPASYPSWAKMRTHLEVLANSTASGSTFTLGLYPVSGATGAAANLSVTAGTVVTGSTAAVATPAAGSMTATDSTSFAVPTAGFYALQLVITTNMAASSAVGVRGRLDVRY